MTEEQYLKICRFLSEIVAGTEWEGHVFVVGGAVRSFVMGDVIKDIDIVVDLPDGGIRFGRWIKDNGYTHRSLVEYERFGVTMFHLDEFPDEAIECVYTRCEKYPDRSTRNPETQFGTLQEDCFRRDLTINALYYNVSTGEVLDLTGKGLQDIRDHVIRVTTDPDIIFDDDPLRILRAIRFSARYGWAIEEQTLSGMKANVHRLEMLSQERVTDELNKMLLSDHPAYAMRMLQEIGALPYVLPEFVETVEMTQNRYHNATVWEHTLAVLDGVKSRELVVRIAALFHDIGKTAVRSVGDDGEVHFLAHEMESGRIVDHVLRRMRYPVHDIMEVRFLVENHMRLKHYGDSLSRMRDKRLRKLLYQCGTKERFLRLADLIHADNCAHSEGHCMPNQIPQLLERAKAEERMFSYKLPVSGNDVKDNCPIEHPSDIRLYLEHALVMAFAKPEMTREDFINDFKHFHPNRSSDR